MQGDWKRIFKNAYIKALREYYFVGGMSETVGKFIETNDAISSLIWAASNSSNGKLKALLLVDDMHDFRYRTPKDIARN